MLKKLLGLLLLTLAGSVHAEIPLTQQDLLGEWKIDAEAITLDGRGRKELTSQWTFREDGKMEGFSSDANAHARISEIRSSIDYKIENGKLIKQVAPGRSKTETCVAVEKTPPKLVLECNQIYFFMTKQ